MNRPGAILVGTLALLLPGPYLRADFTDVRVDPPSLTLRGPGASWSLLVEGKNAAGRVVDLTNTARFQSANAEIAAVSDQGLVRATGDGMAQITVEVAGQRLVVPVQVGDSTQARVFHFENDIMPILNRFGCNSSGCHGKADGQNGFKLSVFGFDPRSDHAALTMEARGRRIFPAAPDHSLFLMKAAGQVPHGGGTKILPGTSEYKTLRDWVAAGAVYGPAETPRVVSIRLEPKERVLDMAGRQQLRVIARYSDGREIDATGHAKFQSNQEAVARVSYTGLVQAGDSPGSAAVMASYQNAVAVFGVLVPRADKVEFAFPAVNFIDTLVSDRLRKLNIAPSELADDAEYLRRVYLDVIGTLPTPAEARSFLADNRPDKRARLVDELLARPEFADYWALKWADLLRVDRQALGHKRAYAYYRWLRESLAGNMPLDRLAREVVIAEGPLDEVGPANFYKVVTKPGEAASQLTQVFMGMRIACAECHHHPFDRWSQADYYGMQAFFTPLQIRARPQGEALFATGDPVSKIPQTGEVVFAHGLGAEKPAASPNGDRRLALADWLTAADNPYFARNLANRVWAHLQGRGLVEPVDDVRATNPPSNPELLDALARSLIESKYDLRALIRTITASRVYQLASKPNATNARDEQNYSRRPFKRVEAEVLLDMVSQSTGVPEKFPGVPAGTRAIQLWDSKVSHYFLQLYGRPVRASACECERNHQPGVAQVLHLLNSPEMHGKLNAADGGIARLVATQADNAKLVEELYLAFYSRPPSEKEQGLAVAFIAKAGDRRQAAEDLAWTLLNSLEFIFNH